MIAGLAPFRSLYIMTEMLLCAKQIIKTICILFMYQQVCVHVLCQDS